jgi:restriction system protein
LANEQQMWGIHGGRTGDANTLFLQENCIALGWHKVGDLSKLAANRDAFKAEVADKFPDKKAGQSQLMPGNSSVSFTKPRLPIL